MPGATKYIHQWDRDLEDVEVLAEDGSSGILLTCRWLMSRPCL